MWRWPTPGQAVRNGLGEYLSQIWALTQLRIAETEKYAHVTFFFNGGVETVVPRRGPGAGALSQGGHL